MKMLLVKMERLQKKVCGVVRPFILKRIISVFGENLPEGLYRWAGACRVTVSSR